VPSEHSMAMGLSVTRTHCFPVGSFQHMLDCGNSFWLMSSDQLWQMHILKE